MNFLKEATNLILNNPEKNPKIKIAKTSEDTILARIIVGIGENVQDVVIYNASKEEISYIEKIISEIKMNNAKKELKNNDAWSLKNI